MPRPSLPALLTGLTLAVAGCGGQESSAERFEGEEREIAQVVEDLQAASADRDAAEICSRILSRELVDRLSAGGLDCTDELEKGLADADEFELTVERVELRGDTATARVRDGKGRPQRIGFVREGGGWRADALATS